MSKYIAVAAALAVAGIFFFRPDLNFPGLFPDNDPIKTEAWNVFERYLEFAKNHDLTGLKALSHQTSGACADPAQEETCFALMDGIYKIGKTFDRSGFKYKAADARQIIMYTNGPNRTFLYFTIDPESNPKVL
ncbi:MAG: hypothetical protein AAB695_00875, partial [Patescibacteria group bacterium]